MSHTEQRRADASRGNRTVLWFAGGVAALLLIVAAFSGWRFASEFAAAPVPPAEPPTRIAVTPQPSALTAGTSASASASAPISVGATLAPASAAVAQAAVRPAGAFTPRGARDYPEGPTGEMVRQGEQIFLRTGVYAKAYVGNSLNCVNCHMDAGRLANAAPLWGAYGMYPAYRAKTKQVDTFGQRLRGCFTDSMNGKSPPDGSDVLVALTMYAYWMAQGAPTGEKLPGAGFPNLAKPAQAPDLERGRAVYVASCALCHGADGQGQRAGDEQVFPPLWGAQSFNWGAGMANLNLAAGFIKANMPLSKGNTLTDQQAWDVAYFMDSHERPQDPRFDGNIARTRDKFHDTENSLYGQTVGGKLLGQGTPTPKR